MSNTQIKLQSTKELPGSLSHASNHSSSSTLKNQISKQNSNFNPGINHTPAINNKPDESDRKIDDDNNLFPLDPELNQISKNNILNNNQNVAKLDTINTSLAPIVVTQTFNAKSSIIEPNKSKVNEEENTKTIDMIISPKTKKQTVMINIQLGEGISENLVLTEDDNPELAAKKFCEEHELDEEVIPMLLEIIHKGLGQDFQVKNSTLLFTSQTLTIPNEDFQANKVVEYFDQISLPHPFHDTVDTILENKTKNQNNIPNKNEKPAFFVTLNLGPDENYTLPIYDKDNVVDLATDFCKKNDIDESAIEYVAQAIQDQLKIHQQSSNAVSPSKEDKKPINNDINQDQKNSTTTEIALLNDLNKDSKRETEKDNNDKERASDSLAINQDNNKNNKEDGIAKSDENQTLYENWSKFIKETTMNNLNESNKNHTSQIKENSILRWSQRLSPNRSLSPDQTLNHAIQNHSISPINGSVTSQINTKRQITKEEQEKLYSRLYTQSFEQKQKLQVKREQINNERKLAESQELTFTPKIIPTKSDNSSILGSNQSPQNTSRRDISRLYEDGKKLKDREARIQKIQEQVLLEDCPFKPNLSPKTHIIASHRDKSPIHEKLFMMASTGAKKKEEFMMEEFEAAHPFKPKISPSPTNYSSRPKYKDKNEFFENLANERKNPISAKNRLKQTLDISDGQKMFHPKVNHDKYYWKIKKRDDEKYGIGIDPDRLSTRRIEKKSTNNSNEELVDHIKDIFKKLDEDSDGYISRNEIDLSRLDKNILEIIDDLINVVYEDDKKYAFDDFLQLCSNLKLQDKLKHANNSKSLSPSISNENNKNEQITKNVSPNIQPNNPSNINGSAINSRNNSYKQKNKAESNNYIKQTKPKAYNNKSTMVEMLNKSINNKINGIQIKYYKYNNNNNNNNKVNRSNNHSPAHGNLNANAMGNSSSNAPISNKDNRKNCFIEIQNYDGVLKHYKKLLQNHSPKHS